MKDVRLLQVVELVASTDKLSRREPPVGQVIEEHLVRHKPRHGDNGEARARLELLVYDSEVRNAAAVEVQCLMPSQQRLVSPVREYRALTPVQEIPDGMVVRRIAGPVLVDDIVIVTYDGVSAHDLNVERV